MDEYSPQRKVSEVIVLVLSFTTPRQKECCWILWTLPTLTCWIGRWEQLSSRFLLMTLLCCFSQKAAVLQHESTWKSTRFPFCRAKHFSTSWVWKRTVSSQEARRGRPRQVGRGEVVSYTHASHQTFIPKFSLNGTTTQVCFQLNTNVPESCRVNSLCLIGILFFLF